MVEPTSLAGDAERPSPLNSSLPDPCTRPTSTTSTDSFPIVSTHILPEVDRLQARLSMVGGLLVKDLLSKLGKSDVPSLSEVALSLVQSNFDSLTSEEYSSLPLSQLLLVAASAKGKTVSGAALPFDSVAAVRWLHEKYGVSDAPIFTPRTPGHSGSFRTPGETRYRTTIPRLPSQFDPQEATSVGEISEYLLRKWGGLAEIASPDRLIFSEMALRDTLDGLTRIGFTQFFEVNAAYSTRGSRTLLAFTEGSSEPTIVFCSFVSRDLLDHKLMQMKLTFPEHFEDIRLLTGSAFRSWQVAELNVRKQLQLLPKHIPLDDIVLGYTDVVLSELERRGAVKLGSWSLSTSPQDQFAQLSVYTVTGKSTLPRHIGVFHDVALRYFGRSVQPLIEPLLERGVDRIIFAGSAGSLDRTIPPHGLIIPKTFLKDSSDGRSTTRIDLDNELHQLVPMGISHSGKHLSVKSPLVESRRFVDHARTSEQVTSIDVEGAKIAEIISNHNQRTGQCVRFASAYILTDYPVGSADTDNGAIGLHNPQFASKSATKRRYAAVLNLLWGIPDTYTPSNHTRLISNHFGARINEFLSQGNDVALGSLYGDVESRLREVSQHTANDRWVSLGLVKSYRDIARMLKNNGIIPLRVESSGEDPLFIDPIPTLAPSTQRTLLLQSLTRSATLNSGIVGYRPGEHNDTVRSSSLQNATKAVDYILGKRGTPLTVEMITELHRILTVGVLEPARCGAIRDFSYNPEGKPPLHSSSVLSEYVSWLTAAQPTPLTALEAYWRFEHFHPFADSSGRVAELIAQHTMLRGVGHPLLFPSRFDIEYILSLNRNGADPSYKKAFTEQTVNRSIRFSRWLSEQAEDTSLATAHFDKENGVVAWTDTDGAIVRLCSFFKTATHFRLDREKREFISPSTSLPAETSLGTLVRSLTVPYLEFDWIAAVYRSSAQ